MNLDNYRDYWHDLQAKSREFIPDVISQEASSSYDNFQHP